MSPTQWPDRARARATSLVPSLPSPTTRSDLVQILKAVIAAVGAWLVAAEVFGLTESFLAPWTALLTVHATVYRSFSRGLQALGASLTGIFLSYTVVEILGPTPLALGIALLVGMLLGRTTPIRDEGSTVATTAIFVITAGQAEQGTMLLDRITATAIGVVIGIVVNVVIFAPLDDGLARREVDALCTALGRLLTGMSTALRSDEDIKPERWIERSREADERLVRAWELLRHTREARVGNPRGRSRLIDASAFEALLLRLEEGIAQSRTIARTVERSPVSPDRWDRHFRDEWLPLLEALGDGLVSPDADVASLRPRLTELMDEMSGDGLPLLVWPVYGTLLNSTRNIIDIVDDVASGRVAR